MSTDILKALINMPLHADDIEQSKLIVQYHEEYEGRKLQSSCNSDGETSLVLAGLHACKDLSVTMLKTFMECKEVKAVVSIGCCYNLLSEEGSGIPPPYGFPRVVVLNLLAFILEKVHMMLLVRVQRDGEVYKVMLAFISLSCMLSVLLFKG